MHIIGIYLTAIKYARLVTLIYRGKGRSSTDLETPALCSRILVIALKCSIPAEHAPEKKRHSPVHQSPRREKIKTITTLIRNRIPTIIYPEIEVYKLNKKLCVIYVTHICESHMADQERKREGLCARVSC